MSKSETNHFIKQNFIAVERSLSLIHIQMCIRDRHSPTHHLGRCPIGDQQLHMRCCLYEFLQKFYIVFMLHCSSNVQITQNQLIICFIVFVYFILLFFMKQLDMFVSTFFRSLCTCHIQIYSVYLKPCNKNPLVSFIRP